MPQLENDWNSYTWCWTDSDDEERSTLEQIPAVEETVPSSPPIPECQSNENRCVNASPYICSLRRNYQYGKPNDWRNTAPMNQLRIQYSQMDPVWEIIQVEDKIAASVYPMLRFTPEAVTQGLARQLLNLSSTIYHLNIEWPYYQPTDDESQESCGQNTLVCYPDVTVTVIVNDPFQDHTFTITGDMSQTTKPVPDFKDQFVTVNSTAGVPFSKDFTFVWNAKPTYQFKQGWQTIFLVCI